MLKLSVLNGPLCTSAHPRPGDAWSTEDEMWNSKYQSYFSPYMRSFMCMITIGQPTVSVAEMVYVSIQLCYFLCTLLNAQSGDYLRFADANKNVVKAERKLENRMRLSSYIDVCITKLFVSAVGDTVCYGNDTRSYLSSNR